MTVSTLTVKTVLLLTTWVLLSALLAGIFPIPLFHLSILTLIFVHRHFLEPQTVRVLAWVVTTMVCVWFLVACIGWLTTIDIFESAPRLTWVLRSPNTYWVELFLGTLAGLMWPNLFLSSSSVPQTPRKLNIIKNIVPIVLFAYLGGLLITLSLIWPFWLGVLEWSPAFDIMRDFGSVASGLLALSLIAATIVEWPGFAEQTRRVVLGGLSGIVVTTILQLPFDELREVAIRSVERSAYSPNDAVTVGTMLSIWIASARVVGGLGLTLGVWAGLRWPERLLLPSRISKGTQRVRIAKHAAAMTVYLMMAFLVHATIALAMAFLVWG